LAADETEVPEADAAVLEHVVDAAVPVLAVEDKMQHQVAVAAHEEQCPEQEILLELLADRMRRLEDVGVEK
jgi:hypothetical protein